VCGDGVDRYACEGGQSYQNCIVERRAVWRDGVVTGLCQGEILVRYDFHAMYGYSMGVWIAYAHDV